MVILMNAAILSKFEQKRFLDNELQLSQSKFQYKFLALGWSLQTLMRQT